MKKRPTKAAKAATKGKTPPAEQKRRGGRPAAKARASSWEEETRKRLVESKPNATPEQIDAMLERMKAIRAEAEAKHRGRKPASETARKKSKTECDKLLASAPAVTIPDGLLKEDFEIQAKFACLMNRCVAPGVDGEIARHETKAVFMEMLNTIFLAAQESSKPTESAWAGEILAEVLVALSKGAPALASNAGFSERMQTLQGLKKVASPVWDWIERAQLRINFLLEWAEGLQPCASLTEFEKTIPSLFESMESLKGDQLHLEVFEKIVWPWLQENENEIKSEAWFLELAPYAKNSKAKNLTLSLLMGEFRRIWCEDGYPFMKRPVGRLYRIERPQ
jgi:hypothetical protein